MSARAPEVAVGVAARREARRPLLALPRALHLLVLWSLAVAQPLLDLLGRYPEFFTIRDATSAQVVAFAAAVILAPPLVLWLAVLLASAASRSLGAAVHLLVVGVLVALLALRAARLLAALPTAAAFALALAAGGLAALAYGRSAPARSFVSVLAPVPLAVGALFLFASPASALLEGDGPTVAGATEATRTPVVLIVFDELSTVSLMDRAGRIDAARFPHLGALAAQSTWYRNTTTVHAHTEHAVPAILTGRMPRREAKPVYADHRQNLFTLLGRTHELRVTETLTELCPESLCAGTPAPAAEEPDAGAEAASIVADATIVYLHATLPERLAERLPSISDTWGGFAEAERADDDATTAAGTVCARKICDLARMIGPSARPRLYFLHTLLPHAPWVYLPGGQRYDGSIREMPGMERGGRWSREPWPPVVGYQRHLLQLGYADFGIGRVVEALRRSGLYDQALIVVTADHGANFVAGEPRRLVTPATIDQMAFVPLLVKAPGQQRARVVDTRARTIDILPTIADHLGVRLPWRVDGRSLLRAPPRDPTVVVRSNSWTAVRAPLATLLRRRAEILRRQVATYGDGSVARLFRLGPHGALVGKELSALRVGAGSATVALDGGRVRSFDPGSGLLPAYVTGTVSGLAADAHVAVAVGGVVAAVTRTYRQRGAQRLSLVLDPAALRPGRNELRVFAVEGAGTGAELRELRVAAP